MGMPSLKTTLGAFLIPVSHSIMPRLLADRSQGPSGEGLPRGCRHPPPGSLTSSPRAYAMIT